MSLSLTAMGAKIKPVSSRATRLRKQHRYGHWGPETCSPPRALFWVEAEKGRIGGGAGGIAVKFRKVTGREETGFILAPPPIIGRGRFAKDGKIR